MPEAHGADDQMQIPDLPQPVPATADQNEVTDGESLGVGARRASDRMIRTKSCGRRTSASGCPRVTWLGSLTSWSITCSS